MNKLDSMCIFLIIYDQWMDEVCDILSVFLEIFGRFGLGGDESEKDNLLSVFFCVLQYFVLVRVFFFFVCYLLMEIILDNWVYELIVLWVLWLWCLEYEWV